MPCKLKEIQEENNKSMGDIMLSFGYLLLSKIAGSSVCLLACFFFFGLPAAMVEGCTCGNESVSYFIWH
jgi:hypothetical protein